MATNQRDPRIEPKVGDALKMDFRIWRIAKVDTDVCVYGMDRGREIPMAVCSLNNWPRIAADAEVIHRAD